MTSCAPSAPGARTAEEENAPIHEVAGEQVEPKRRRRQEVRWARSSDDVGKRRQPEPTERRGSERNGNRRREPWADAERGNPCPRNSRG